MAVEDVSVVFGGTDVVAHGRGIRFAHHDGLRCILRPGGEKIIEKGRRIAHLMEASGDGIVLPRGRQFRAGRRLQPGECRCGTVAQCVLRSPLHALLPHGPKMKYEAAANVALEGSTLSQRLSPHLPRSSIDIGDGRAKPRCLSPIRRPDVGPW